VLERRYDAWCRLLATFRAVYGGVQHDRLRLPAYGGALFDPDRFPFLEGRPAGSRAWRRSRRTRCPSTTAPCCTCWRRCKCWKCRRPAAAPAEARRLSFRALDIEQIGHVYEGLLDHEARRAAEPVVGLQGAKNKEPDRVPLPQLEQFGTFDAQADAPGANQLDKLLDFLKAKPAVPAPPCATPSKRRIPHSALRSAFRTPHSALRTHPARGLRQRRGPLPARAALAGLVRDDDYGGRS
jgi:hypothetical protein